MLFAEISGPLFCSSVPCKYGMNLWIRHAVADMQRPEDAFMESAFSLLTCAEGIELGVRPAVAPLPNAPPRGPFFPFPLSPCFRDSLLSHVVLSELEKEARAELSQRAG